MKIAIVGYGKMGKAVERIARERGHSTEVVRYDGQLPPQAENANCVIEFTHASVAPEILRACIDHSIPIVSGTTGWDDRLHMIIEYCNAKNGSMLWAPNFSIGMHIVFEMNKLLATIMDRRQEYDVHILEAHHTEKKDKPSGTAIKLANQIIDGLRRKSRWILDENGNIADDTLPVTAERVPDVKGIHRITYRGPYDVISLRHKALSRDAFALGAVLSAEWLAGKKGVYTFSDVLGIS